MKTRRLALFALALAVGSSASALGKDHNFQAGLHFVAGLPQGEFDDAIDRESYGIDGNFLWSPQSSPFGIGLSLAFMNYGNESRREPFSTTIPDVTVEVTTSNNMFQGHLLLRAQPKKGDIRPYVDGLFGLNYLWTETKISDADDGSEVASSTNQDDAALSYGGGLGTMVRLYTSNPPGSSFSILVDFGARYLFGGEAEYLKKGSIRREDGEVTYDVIKSKTDLLTLHIGFVGVF